MSVTTALGVLAIDTAATACSVAAVGRLGQCAHESIAMDRGHAEALVPLIERVMGGAGIGFADLDLIAVTVGPGAFTGLRVGLATARGLALATGLPCIGVSTTLALAAACRAAGPFADNALIVSVMDSKRGDVYAEAFRSSPAAASAAMDVGSPVSFGAPQAIALTDLHAFIVDVCRAAAGPDSRQCVGPVILAGDARVEAGRILALNGVAVVSAAGTDVVDPVVLVRVAVARWRAERRVAGRPSPIYVRPPQAARAVAGGRRRP